MTETQQPSAPTCEQWKWWEPSEDEAAEMRASRLARRLAESGLPMAWRRRLDSWDRSQSEDMIPYVYHAAFRWVRLFGAASKNLVFCGPTGSGKSHLAGAMLYELCQQGHRVRCEVLSELWGKMKGAYGRDGEEPLDYLTPLQGAEVVLLDDVGSVRPNQPATRWEADSLRDIVNAVLRNGQRLIVTTNHKRAVLERWLQDASVSRRIFENASVVDAFEALPSYLERDEKQNPTAP